MDSSFVSEPKALTALTVKAAVSSLTGVPLISPVDSLNFKPSGSAPLTMLQRMGAVPFVVKPLAVGRAYRAVGQGFDYDGRRGIRDEELYPMRGRYRGLRLLKDAIVIFVKHQCAGDGLPVGDCAS